MSTEEFKRDNKSDMYNSTNRLSHYEMPSKKGIQDTSEASRSKVTACWGGSTHQTKPTCNPQPIEWQNNTWCLLFHAPPRGARKCYPRSASALFTSKIPPSIIRRQCTAASFYSIIDVSENYPISVISHNASVAVFDGDGLVNQRYDIYLSYNSLEGFAEVEENWCNKD